MNKELVNTSLAIGGAFLSAYLTTSAFSLPTKHLISKRAGHSSELNDQDDRPLEAAHLNHDRQDRRYNKLCNGVLVTDIQHLAHHMLFRDRPEEIGLSRFENNKAIASLTNRIIVFNKRNGFPASSKYIKESVNEAMKLWVSFLNIEP